MEIMENTHRGSHIPSFNRRRNSQKRPYNSNTATSGRMNRRNSIKHQNGSQDEDDTVPLWEKMVARRTMDIWLNKKATTYEVFEGQLRVPTNKYNPRRDYITAKQVVATELHRFLPDLSKYEHIAGDIYTFTSNRKVLKDPVTFVLPVNLFNRSKLFELKVKMRRSEHANWEYLDDIHLVDESSGGEQFGQAKVEFQTEQLGAFVPVLSSVAEIFTVTEQGMLYTAKLNHYITLRFPKRAIQDTADISLRILPLNEEKVEWAKADYHDELFDFIMASDFFEFLCPESNFKRAVTVKLPLPATGFDADYHEEIAVLQCTAGGGWKLVEGQLKLTSTTVSFDTRNLGKYCIAKGHPKRKQKLPGAVAILDYLNWRTKHEVLVFTRMSKKIWNVWVELVPADVTISMIEKREREGMVCVYRPDRLTKLERSNSKDQENNHVNDDTVRSYAQLQARNRRKMSATSLEEAKTPPPPSFENSKPAIWAEVDEGVVKIARPELAKTCPVLLNTTAAFSYRCFELEPIAEQYDKLSFNLKLYTDNTVTFESWSSGKDCRNIVATIPITVTKRMMEDYFYVPPEVVEVDEEAPAAEIPQDERKEEPKVRRFFSPEYMARLTISRRAKQILCKEPRVLSGRSLQTLSRQVEEGLTLAVHLQIPDSTITGIGFDALSNGLSLSEVTYKILLRWKRMPGHPKDKVTQLSNALKIMGRHDIVSLLWKYHDDNKELTPDVFAHIPLGEEEAADHH